MFFCKKHFNFFIKIGKWKIGKLVNWKTEKNLVF
jgi:hypothetical protein